MLSLKFNNLNKDIVKTTHPQMTLFILLKTYLSWSFLFDDISTDSIEQCFHSMLELNDFISAGGLQRRKGRQVIRMVIGYSREFTYRIHYSLVSLIDILARNQASIANLILFIDL